VEDFIAVHFAIGMIAPWKEREFEQVVGRFFTSPPFPFTIMPAAHEPTPVLLFKDAEAHGLMINTFGCLECGGCSFGCYVLQIGF
jgi:hypothetical protein